MGDFLRTETVENSPDYDNGYGFCLPTKELYDYFLPDDHVRRDAAIFTYDELVTKPNANIQDESKKLFGRQALTDLISRDMPRRNILLSKITI